MKAAINEWYVYVDVEDQKYEDFDVKSFVFDLVKIKDWGGVISFVSNYKCFFYYCSYRIRDSYPLYQGEGGKPLLEYHGSPVSGDLLRALQKHIDFDYLDKMFLEDNAIAGDKIEVYEISHLMNLKSLVTRLMQYVAVANGADDDFSIVNFDVYNIDSRVVDLLFSDIPSDFMIETPRSGRCLADQQYFRADEVTRDLLEKTSHCDTINQQMDLIFAGDNAFSGLNSRQISNKLREELSEQMRDSIPYFKYCPIISGIDSRGCLDNDVYVHIRVDGDMDAERNAIARVIAGEIAELVFDSLERNRTSKTVYRDGGFVQEQIGYYLDDIYDFIEESAMKDRLSLCGNCGLPVQKRKNAAYCSNSCRTIASEKRRDAAIKFAASGKSVAEAVAAIGKEYESSIKRWYEETLGTDPAR